jgi:hypothetical protein
MDEEREQPEPEQPTGPAPADAAAPAPPPPTHARRVRGALASRAAGWVVAVALAGAVVALSAVLAASPPGLQVQALAGPASITAVPGPAVQMPATVTGPSRAQVRVVRPALLPRAICAIHSGPGSFRVVLPAGPGQPGQVILMRPRAVTVKPGPFTVRPGTVTLVPAVVCPPG